ncbi:hypothetical protein [Mesoflavibacter zeaxanthinifaciens]|uniref:hypothetical protein n=1 Tax=Mesoflavibacter zeaxanthinifaciens TaxID=393060 RepID=UPI0026F0093E|nr:hypothetical protein [Mesoflavibacter zeaxanthinifaciens]
MSTSLYAISNIRTPENPSFQYLKEKTEALNAFNFGNTFKTYSNENGKLITKTDAGSWYHESTNENGFLEISFNGGSSYDITLMPNLGYISFLLKYKELYGLYKDSYLTKFRKELYQIVNLFGGSEVIFLADNGCDKLSYYLELMAWKNIPYQEIKQQMINDLGKPITNYTLLNESKISYKHITEFVMDDFLDIS